MDYNSNLVKAQNDPYDSDKLEAARNSCLEVTEAVINIVDSDCDESMDDFDYTESEIESMKNGTFCPWLKFIIRDLGRHKTQYLDFSTSLLALGF